MRKLFAIWALIDGHCRATIWVVYAGRIYFWCIADQLYEQFTQIESISRVLQRNYMSSLRALLVTWTGKFLTGKYYLGYGLWIYCVYTLFVVVFTFVLTVFLHWNIDIAIWITAYCSCRNCPQTHISVVIYLFMSVCWDEISLLGMDFDFLEIFLQ